MTAYIVRKGAQKKKEIFKKREAELLHQISSQASLEKITKAAERLRTAQKAVIKCLFHETEAVKPEDEKMFAARWQQLEQDREYWEDVSTAEIIDQYAKEIQQSEP